MKLLYFLFIRFLTGNRPIFAFRLDSLRSFVDSTKVNCVIVKICKNVRGKFQFHRKLSSRGRKDRRVFFFLLENYHAINF